MTFEMPYYAMRALFIIPFRILKKQVQFPSNNLLALTPTISQQISRLRDDVGDGVNGMCYNGIIAVHADDANDILKIIEIKKGCDEPGKTSKWIIIGGVESWTVKL